MAVKSAERVLKIFDLLEGSSDGLTNKDISTRLNYAPSSTIALLQTMAENGYLAVDEQKRYSLGGKLVSLGAVAASRFDKMCIRDRLKVVKPRKPFEEAKGVPLSLRMILGSP